MESKIGGPDQITELLGAVRRGETGAMDKLLPLVYDHLRGVARGQLRQRRPGQTLDTTALVHEAYLKMAHRPDIDWQDRSHFLAVAAVAMRHILVDHARRRLAEKRGGGAIQVTLDDPKLGVQAKATEILALDQALSLLEQLSARLSKLVELRFFAGLTVTETAEVMSISERTVKRDWRKARAFLYSTLAERGAG